MHSRIDPSDMRCTSRRSQDFFVRRIFPNLKNGKTENYVPKIAIRQQSRIVHGDSLSKMCLGGRVRCMILIEIGHGIIILFLSHHCMSSQPLPPLVVCVHWIYYLGSVDSSLRTLVYHDFIIR